ncbi:PAS domain-containing protein [Pseudolysobacter antarcticus]|uniref:PAS domain-containing protein n=1 Tax=Pseudolysobacter antarcticus TaxID=2511995 RepID=UPI001A926FAC|nr:PAS domain-containing protein [Pseudolysobacter antarcticus]
MSDTRSDAANVGDFLQRGGLTGALIRDYDWAATALGPIGSWPQSLKSAVGMVVHSTVPIVLLWGSDGIMIYNDAYSRFAGARHPQALGAKVRESWAEVADFNDNVMKVGLSGGTLAYKDQELTLYRHGIAEQVWMNLDYSPVLDERGVPAGVVAIVVETTARVLADRRNAAERDRLRKMFEQAPGFMALFEGPNHVFTFANAAYMRLIGPRDVIGKPVREALPEVGEQGFFDLLDECYTSARPFLAHHSESVCAVLAARSKIDSSTLSTSR